MKDVFEGKHPEEVLGARKGETNKAAFRRQAKRFHPDAGSEPDAARFDQVTQAYRLLEDPEAFARWEKTGSTERPQAPEIQSIIMEVFLAVLSKHHDNAKYRNIIADIKIELLECIARTRDERTQHSKNAEDAEGIACKFEPQESFMAQFLFDQARHARRAMEACDVKIEAVERAIAELDNHKFNPDKKPEAMQVFRTAGISITSTSSVWNF